MKRRITPGRSQGASFENVEFSLRRIRGSRREGANSLERDLDGVGLEIGVIQIPPAAGDYPFYKNSLLS